VQRRGRGEGSSSAAVLRIDTSDRAVRSALGPAVPLGAGVCGRSLGRDHEKQPHAKIKVEKKKEVSVCVCVCVE